VKRNPLVFRARCGVLGFVDRCGPILIFLCLDARALRIKNSSAVSLTGAISNDLSLRKRSNKVLSEACDDLITK